LALLVLAGTVGCQMPANNAQNDDLKKAIDKLADNEQQFGRIFVTRTEHEQLRAENAKSFDALRSEFGRLDATERDHAKRIAGLSDEVNEQRNLWMETERKLVDLDSHVRAHEGDRANPTYAIETAKRELHPNVPPSSPRQPDVPPTWGIVRIENQMADWMHMEVNGFPYGVAPRRTLDVMVPVGEATTRLVGFEEAKTWRVGAPDYVQRVLITPQPAFDSVVRYP
jgi:hypothetical protein